MLGEVAQISIKNKIDGEVGLPKIAIGEVYINEIGVEGDYNNFRMERKKGTKKRAVLIHTVEMLNQLKKEGWPIKWGDLGENILLRGINYEKIKLNMKFEIGEIILEVAEICNPCNNLAELEYVGKENVKEFILSLKSRRGWYCEVVKDGTVKKGDKVKLL